jgi:hypothetical protein
MIRGIIFDNRRDNTGSHGLYLISCIISGLVNDIGLLRLCRFLEIISGFVSTVRYSAYRHGVVISQGGALHFASPAYTGLP